MGKGLEDSKLNVASRNVDFGTFPEDTTFQMQIFSLYLILYLFFKGAFFYAKTLANFYDRAYHF